jgi:hypothetical protein
MLESPEETRTVANPSKAQSDRRNIMPYETLGPSPRKRTQSNYLQRCRSETIRNAGIEREALKYVLTYSSAPSAVIRLYLAASDCPHVR